MSFPAGAIPDPLCRGAGQEILGGLWVFLHFVAKHVLVKLYPKMQEGSKKA